MEGSPDYGDGGSPNMDTRGYHDVEGQGNTDGNRDGGKYTLV